ncbi:hypothetical protein D9757_005890 [Collybiopsis confluens]|uniref:Glucose-methanol-choline oxidoreductase N-terminal domain-containing protein n=1 Tax=Collybiopsis confluens TaxID=2823264 RepID=A0A8H5HNY0_9AGAR|nr:hypothetical protein D9757_005890 [Collybiopsis confluens]
MEKTERTTNNVILIYLLRYIDANTGKRSDTAHHFIYNLEDKKHNLQVLTNSRVVRVIFEDSRAVGVECATRKDFKDNNIGAQGTTNRNKVVYASRLVVLSSGAFGSPAILERSGIGSEEILKRVDIPQIVDLPGVGENYKGKVVILAKLLIHCANSLIDHNLCTSAYFASEDSDCLDEIFTGKEDAIRPYLPLPTSSVDAGVKLRPITPEDFEELGPSFKNVWNTNFDGLIVDPPGTKTFGIIFGLMYPRAVGYTHVTSGNNPWAPLKFKHGFLEDLSDVAVLRWCYKRGRELARRMKSFRGEILARHPKFSSSSETVALKNNDANPVSLIRTASGPIRTDSRSIVYSSEDNKAIDDYLGTCAMKPRADGGVVDSRLNVYGVQNLKVADMSIAPSNVGANTYNTALIIGSVNFPAESTDVHLNPNMNQREKAFLIIAEDLGIDVSD